MSAPRIAFGPVPSRRLGRSLGINNVPPKVCTYSCVYCQVGRTSQMQIERQAFYPADDVVREVTDKVAETKAAGETINYLSFVPDGEPTLDENLGRTMDLLRPLGIPIAVISNASLLWRADVREELGKADWVSLKVDAVGGEAWRSINRPHGRLQLGAVRAGMLEFARTFAGELATETMLVEGVNDGEDILRENAAFVARLRPAVAYLSIPTRPPAESWVKAPAVHVIDRAYAVFAQRLERVECLIAYEGDEFTSTGDVAEDLLRITAVHPMRHEAVAALLARAGAAWSLVEGLLERGELREVEYGGERFLVRKRG